MLNTLQLSMLLYGFLLSYKLQRVTALCMMLFLRMLCHPFYCDALSNIALHCLHYAALCYITLFVPHYTALLCVRLHYIALH